MPVALPGLSRVRTLALAALVVIAGCAGSIPNYDYAKEPDPRGTELTLGVGDVIAINVWENANLNTEATIRPDGTITMPLIGDVKAGGETPTSLKEHLQGQLQNFVRSPAITVSVRSWKSYRFTIQGEVSRPGVITSDQYVTVGDAIAMAGGLSRFAKRDEIILMRRDAKTGKIRQIPLNYELLASGKRPDMNIYMLAGDTIWVP
ncbi:MAG TPA: polysaccharide biosynthesis/export family protein [Kofleriaceae bacterium]|nr:polysaccharide biosynthesis/export family protein [Kofleriaceae bacterium]